MKCPKCGHERQLPDESPDWQCPRCGVAYAKVKENATIKKKPLAHSRRATHETVRGTIHKTAWVSYIGVLLLGLFIGYISGKEHHKPEINNTTQKVVNQTEGDYAVTNDAESDDRALASEHVKAICGSISSTATEAVKLREYGEPWSSVEAVVAASMSDLDELFKSPAIEVVKSAYFSGKSESVAESEALIDCEKRFSVLFSALITVKHAP